MLYNIGSQVTLSLTTLNPKIHSLIVQDYDTVTEKLSFVKVQLMWH